MLKSLPKNALEVIEHFVEQMIAMFNDGNVESLLATMTDDAMIMPPNEPKIGGKEAIRSWIKSFFAPFKKLSPYLLSRRGSGRRQLGVYYRSISANADP